MGHLLTQSQELEGCKLSVDTDLENFSGWKDNQSKNRIQFEKKYDVILLSKSKYLLGT